MLVQQEDLIRYRKIVDGFVDEAVSDIINTLPDFFAHVAFMNSDEQFYFENLSMFGSDVEEMSYAAAQMASSSGAVGTILFFGSWLPDFKEDDPEYELYKENFAEIPQDKRKYEVIIYSEVLGSYRKAVSIPLDKNKKLDGNVIELNAKKFDYYPILFQNSRLN